MKIKIFFPLVLVAGMSVFALAQNVGINTNSPLVSLDVEGALALRSVVLDPVANVVMLPQDVSFVVISPVGVTGPVTISDPESLVDGRRLVVFNNSNQPASFGAITIQSGQTKEFICQNPGGWVGLTPGSSETEWSIQGNASTDPDTNYIGTSDNQPLVFRTNAIKRMRLLDDGLKLNDGVNVELGYDIPNKPFGNGSISYNLFGQYPSLDIFGAGTDFAGYDRRITFWAQGGSSFYGGASFNGHVVVNGELRPNGDSGLPGQVLTNQGFNNMSWAYPEKQGQLLEVSPYTADTAAIRDQGFTLVGSQTKTIQKTTKSGGSLAPWVSTLQLDPNAHLFYFSAQEKIFVVSSGSIASLSLANSTYGTLTAVSVPSFNLTNTIPVFTGSKILIYPHFIFDCATGTTSNFPTNPCSGFITTPTQVWTGTYLVIYGPGEGIKYNPGTNTITCFDNGDNLYYPECKAVWTGNVVIYYGGYLLSLGDTVSVDLGYTYNPVTDVWDSFYGGSMARIHGHQALWTGSEMMIFGGKLDEGNNYEGIKFYNPTTMLWNTGYTPGTALFLTNRNTKSILTDNKVYVFSSLDLGQQTNTFEERYFNLPTKTWVNFTPSFRNGDINALASAVDVNELIHIFPSYRPCGYAINYLHFYGLEAASTYLYPLYNANVTLPASYASVPKEVEQDGDYVFLFGKHNGGLSLQKSKKRYTRTATFNQPTDREGHVCVPIGNQKFMIWGGKSGATYYNNGAIYDAVLNSWTAISLANAPSARSGHSAAFGGGKVIIWGGNAGAGYFNNGKIYDVNTNTWTSIPTLGGPTCTQFAYIDWDGDEFLVYCNFIYKFNPTLLSWQFLSPDGGSNERSSSSTDYTIRISGYQGSIFQKAENTAYPMDGSGLVYVDRNTQFLSGSEILLGGSTEAQLYSAIAKDFKFTNLTYQPIDAPTFDMLQAFPGNVYGIFGVRPPVNGSCGDHYTDAIMIFTPNAGADITKPINVNSLLYRKN